MLPLMELVCFADGSLQLCQIEVKIIGGMARPVAVEESLMQVQIASP